MQRATTHRDVPVHRIMRFMRARARKPAKAAAWTKARAKVATKAQKGPDVEETRVARRRESSSLWLARAFLRVTAGMSCRQLTALFSPDLYSVVEVLDCDTKSAHPAVAADVPWYVAWYLGWHHKKYRVHRKELPAWSTLDKLVNTVRDKLSWRKYFKDAEPEAASCSRRIKVDKVCARLPYAYARRLTCANWLIKI